MSSFCDLDEQINFWEIIGSGDEENTETAHAKYNQYDRRFGNLRGYTKQKAKTRTKLFDGVPFIQEKMNAINNGTKRGKSSHRTREDDGVQTTFDFDDNVEDVQEPLGADLNKLEKDMNKNVCLRYPQASKDKEGRDEEEYKHHLPIKNMNTNILPVLYATKED